MFVLFMSLIYFLVVALFLFIDLYRMNQIDRYVISAYYFETLCSIWKRFDMMDYLIWIECISCCEKRSSFKCWRWQKFTLKSFVTLNNMRYTEILAFYGSTKIGKILLSKVSRVKISSFRWEMSMLLLFVSYIVKMTWILWFSKTLDMLYISSVERIRWTACDVANSNNISEKNVWIDNNHTNLFALLYFILFSFDTIPHFNQHIESSREYLKRNMFIEFLVHTPI